MAFNRLGKYTQKPRPKKILPIFFLSNQFAVIPLVPNGPNFKFGFTKVYTFTFKVVLSNSKRPAPRAI